MSISKLPASPRINDPARSFPQLNGTADGAPVTIVRAVQTCWVCPSQWNAWTDDGHYLYLRYRNGRGTATCYPSPDVTTWQAGGQLVAEFGHGSRYDGSILLAEFCALADLDLDLMEVQA